MRRRSLELEAQQLLDFYNMDLGGNQIGCAGAAALAASLPSLPALEKIHLRFNKIGARGRAALEEVRPRMPALRHLVLEIDHTPCDITISYIFTEECITYIRIL